MLLVTVKSGSKATPGGNSVQSAPLQLIYLARNRKEAPRKRLRLLYLTYTWCGSSCDGFVHTECFNLFVILYRLYKVQIAVKAVRIRPHDSQPTFPSVASGVFQGNPPKNRLVSQFFESCALFAYLNTKVLLEMSRWTIDACLPICETKTKSRTREYGDRAFSVYARVKEKRKVGGKRYEARSRGRSSPDTLAFWACEHAQTIEPTTAVCQSMDSEWTPEHSDRRPTHQENLGEDDFQHAVLVVLVAFHLFHNPQQHFLPIQQSLLQRNIYTVSFLLHF